MDLEDYTLSTRGIREHAQKENVLYSRKVGTTEWTLVETPPIEVLCTLMAVREYQVESEPNYWSLFLALEGQNGTVYQVTGDTENMYLEVLTDANILASESLRDVYEIATLALDEAVLVAHHITQEVPPFAPMRAQVTENCQGWTVRVVAKLIGDNTVDAIWYERLRAMMEPIL